MVRNVRIRWNMRTRGRIRIMDRNIRIRCKLRTRGRIKIMVWKIMIRWIYIVGGGDRDIIARWRLRYG